MNALVGTLRDWLTVPAPEYEEEAAEGELARASRRARRMMLVLALILLPLSLLPIDSAVIGSGEVSVDSRVKTITHPTGGVLSEVRVREGQHVRAGQVLMLLDRSVLGPSARNSALNRDQLLALRARLEAERDDRSVITFPAELTSRTDPAAREAMERERRQFELARRERDNNLALLAQRTRQAQEQISSYRVQIDATQRQLALIKPELEGLRSLKERGLVTLGRLNQAERTAVQLEGSEASLQADIAQAEAQISQIREQMLNVSQTRRVEAGNQLTTTLAQLSDESSRAVATQDTLARARIVAPQDGVVDQIAFTTVGSAIPAGEPIVRLVPDQDKLIVTARVAPPMVDGLRVGQRARVRFSSLDRQTSPEIEGKLAFVSADRTDDPNTGVSFYRTRIEIDARELDQAAGDNLRAGQPVEVFFTTGRRSLLAYALKPLLDQFRRAMRE